MNHDRKEWSIQFNDLDDRVGIIPIRMIHSLLYTNSAGIQINAQQGEYRAIYYTHAIAFIKAPIAADYQLL